MSRCAWITLATNDAYSLGALVVAYSLKRVSTIHQLAVLITPGVSQAMRDRLGRVFDVVKCVNVLDSQDSANLAVLKRPELGITFTKLHCWNMTQFDKCVFLDADVLVLKNCDELFERDELSASPDVGWPDCFNSGVFVFKPSIETYGKLIKFASENGSFDGGDQGLLNQFFSDWSRSEAVKRLPFFYNTASTATYSYLPAFRKYNEEIRIIHFIGESKPWCQQFNSVNKQVEAPSGFGHLTAYFQLWWDIFFDSVHPQLSEEMSGIAGALANLKVGTERSAEQIANEEKFRRFNWEAGQIDYLGADSFTNIWKKIQQTIDSTQSSEVVEKPRERSRSKTKSPEPVSKVTSEVTKPAQSPVVAPVTTAPVQQTKPAQQQVKAQTTTEVKKVQPTTTAPVVAQSAPAASKSTKKEGK